MQIIDPLDPTMIILYGMIFALVVFFYASTTRKPTNIDTRPDDVSSMAGGRVEEITTGAVQEPMLDHLVSIEEERLEHEGESL
jgi:hypothetical protein